MCANVRVLEVGCQLVSRLDGACALVWVCPPGGWLPVSGVTPPLWLCVCGGNVVCLVVDLVVVNGNGAGAAHAHG